MLSQVRRNKSDVVSNLTCPATVCHSKLQCLYTQKFKIHSYIKEMPQLELSWMLTFREANHSIKRIFKIEKSYEL